MSINTIAQYYDQLAQDEWERLERAAQCLPHCDHQRLLALVQKKHKR